MAKAIGIGGVFFKSKNPKKLSAWYQKHLGVKLESWGGAIFPWEPSDRQRLTVWTAIDAKSKHFAPQKEPYMFNYIVDDLVALIAQLKRAKVKIDKKGIEDSDHGKFAWVFDPEGRKVELWEPPAAASQ